MKSFEQWMSEYAESHQNPTNKAIHKICVPLIMFSVLGLLWAVPRPEFMNISPFLNWASLFAACCLVFYFLLNLKMALYMVGFLFITFTILFYLSVTPFLLPVCLIIFVVAWIGQFWGHKIEGKKPSFLQDLAFLLIGPLWALKSYGFKS